MNAKSPNLLARCLKDYFADHLPRLRGMSPHTIHSYRDSLVLLFRFVALDRKIEVFNLDLTDLEPMQVVGFLAYLERQRGNSIPTRNVRLAAIHAFFRYVGAHHPEHLERAQRMIGVPFKRADQRVIEYFDRNEIEAVLARIDRSQGDGRRDYALLATMFNTGARVQEVVDLRASNLQLSKPYQLRLFGKGRKERFCPLWPQTAQVLLSFCEERQIDLRSDARVFLNHRGGPLTRFGVRYILAKHVERVRAEIPTLDRKRLHPHSMRHSTAVALLKSGVDLTTISQWLGHSSPATTSRYASIDLDMKREAISRVQSIVNSPKAARWPSQTVLQWLESL